MLLLGAGQHKGHGVTSCDCLQEGGEDGWQSTLTLLPETNNSSDVGRSARILLVDVKPTGMR